MGEARLFQVAPHAHLHLHGIQRVKHKAEYLQNDDGQVSRDKGPEARQRTLFDKVVHNISLEQRQQDIRYRHGNIGHHNQQQHPAVGLDKGQQPLPNGKLEGLVVLHNIVPIWICHHITCFL